MEEECKKLQISALLKISETETWVENPLESYGANYDGASSLYKKSEAEHEVPNLLRI